MFFFTHLHIEGLAEVKKQARKQEKRQITKSKKVKMKKAKNKKSKNTKNQERGGVTQKIKKEEERAEIMNE